MVNKLLFTVTFFICTISHTFGQQAKYVFYMIGDGMGLIHVLLAEMYQSELRGEIGRTPLSLSQCPYSSVKIPYWPRHGVNDSGAVGTALATGKKTKNCVSAMDTTVSPPCRSIAYAASDRGLKVGIPKTV